MALKWLEQLFLMHRFLISSAMSMSSDAARTFFCFIGVEYFLYVFFFHTDTVLTYVHMSLYYTAATALLPFAKHAHAVAVERLPPRADVAAIECRFPETRHPKG